MAFELSGLAGFLLSLMGNRLMLLVLIIAYDAFVNSSHCRSCHSVTSVKVTLKKDELLHLNSF